MRWGLQDIISGGRGGGTVSSITDICELIIHTLCSSTHGLRRVPLRRQLVPLSTSAQVLHLRTDREHSAMEVPTLETNGSAVHVPETEAPAPEDSTGPAAEPAGDGPPPPVAADAIDEKLIKVSSWHSKPSPLPRGSAPPAILPPLPEAALRSPLQEFYNDMKSVDRDNEVNRILSAFRLNPFEQLGVRFDATPEEIRRQYRKVSISPTAVCSSHCERRTLLPHNACMLCSLLSRQSKDIFRRCR